MTVARDHPQFIHSPVLPSEDSPVDFLRPPVLLPQEELEDNLFKQYLEIPTEPKDSPQLNAPDKGSAQSDYFDVTMDKNEHI
jgi:hypothetical protein